MGAPIERLKIKNLIQSYYHSICFCYELEITQRQLTFLWWLLSGTTKIKHNNEYHTLKKYFTKLQWVTNNTIYVVLIHILIVQIKKAKMDKDWSLTCIINCSPQRGFESDGFKNVSVN